MLFLHAHTSIQCDIIIMRNFCHGRRRSGWGNHTPRIARGGGGACGHCSGPLLLRSTTSWQHLEGGWGGVVLCPRVPSDPKVEIGFSLFGSVHAPCHWTRLGTGSGVSVVPDPPETEGPCPRPQNDTWMLSTTDAPSEIAEDAYSRHSPSTRPAPASRKFRTTPRRVS
jgi:hypothetical protein